LPKESEGGFAGEGAGLSAIVFLGRSNRYPLRPLVFVVSWWCNVG